MSLSAVEYLRHILDETTYLMDRAQGLSWDEFMSDETLKRAFVRSIEVIGESSKQVPDNFKQKYSRLEWRAMAGMRDRLIHGYFGVDYGLVWDVVTNKILSFTKRSRKLLKQRVLADNGPLHVIRNRIMVTENLLKSGNLTATAGIVLRVSSFMSGSAQHALPADASPC